MGRRRRCDVDTGVRGEPVGGLEIGEHDLSGRDLGVHCLDETGGERVPIRLVALNVHQPGDADRQREEQRACERERGGGQWPLREARRGDDGGQAGRDRDPDGPGRRSPLGHDLVPRVQELQRQAEPERHHRAE